MNQHTQPCKDCPFSKKIEPGALGGSPVETYIGQICGPFWLPCHATHDASKLEERLNTANAQCAGAASFRTNLGIILPEPLLSLPPSELVFDSFEEFCAHHTGLPIAYAKALLLIKPPNEHMEDEMRKAEIKIRQGTAKIATVKKQD